jgi:competence protein ComK
MENGYKINAKTLAIIPVNKHRSKVYEHDNVIFIEKNANKIIEENCEYYGSSYEGRKQGTMKLIGVTHKAPILVEEQNNIVFFPTCSPRLTECGWISVNNIEGYCKYDDSCIVRFHNNFTLELHVSVKSINNQVLRATRLGSLVSKRNTEEKTKIM